MYSYLPVTALVVSQLGQLPAPPAGLADQKPQTPAAPKAAPKPLEATTPAALPAGKKASVPDTETAEPDPEALQKKAAELSKLSETQRNEVREAYDRLAETLTQVEGLSSFDKQMLETRRSTEVISLVRAERVLGERLASDTEYLHKALDLYQGTAQKAAPVFRRMRRQLKQEVAQAKYPESKAMFSAAARLYEMKAVREERLLQRAKPTTVSEEAGRIKDYVRALTKLEAILTISPELLNTGDRTDISDLITFRINFAKLGKAFDTWAEQVGLDTPKKSEPAGQQSGPDVANKQQ
jgi:hypothetical protein